MSAFTALFRRELKAYFTAPVAYVYVLVFAVLNTGLFMSTFFFMKRAEMREFFAFMPWILAIFMPAVSMRLWAEDRRQGTFELLRTLPVSVAQLVGAKFLAGLAFFAVAVAATLTVPMFLSGVGNPDLGPVFSGYIGTVLLGGFFLSAGLFASGISRDQIVAFIVGLIIAVGFTLLGYDFISVQFDNWLPGVGSALRDHVAVTKHFEQFTRGVIDFRSLLYFCFMTGGFLLLDVLTINGITRPAERRTLATGGVLALLAVVLLNVAIGTRSMGRIDLTQEGLFTVSPATGRILSNLDSPVELKLYISPAAKMPNQLQTLERDIADKIGEFAAVSGGQLTFDVVHLDPVEQGLLEAPENQDEEAKKTLEKLHKKGIQPVQVQSFGADENSIKLIYSSLQITYKDKSPETLSPVMPQALPKLEYELLSRVQRLTRERRTKVVLVAPIQQTEQNREMAKLYAQLGQPYRTEEQNDFKKAEEVLRQMGDYDVTRIRSNSFDEKKPLPMDADVVLLFAPAPLDPKRMAEVQQFMVSGKPVVMAVQRNGFGYRPTNYGISVNNKPVDPGIDALLAPIGVNVSNQLVMDEQMETLNMNAGQSRGPFAVRSPVKLPTHVLVTAEQFNQDLSITSGLGNLIYLWGSPITVDKAKADAASTQVTELFSSSSKSWLTEIKEGPLARTDIEPQAGGSSMLAAMIEFNLPSAGAQKPEGMSPEDWAKQAAAKVGERNRMVLFGNAEIFKDALVSSPNHMTLLLNSVGAMTQGEELISIRTKQPIDRSIAKLEGSKAFYRVMVIGGGPGVVIGIGLFSLMNRRRRREEWLADAKKEG